MAITLNKVPGYVWIVVLIGIFLGVGGIVLAEFIEQSDDATADTMINDTLVSLGTFSDWMPIIILVLVIGIVVSILIGALAFSGRR